MRIMCQDWSQVHVYLYLAHHHRNTEQRECLCRLADILCTDLRQYQSKLHLSQHVKRTGGVACSCRAWSVSTMNQSCQKSCTNSATRDIFTTCRSLSERKKDGMNWWREEHTRTETRVNKNGEHTYGRLKNTSYEQETANTTHRRHGQNEASHLRVQKRAWEHGARTTGMVSDHESEVLLHITHLFAERQRIPGSGNGLHPLLRQPLVALWSCMQR